MILTETLDTLTVNIFTMWVSVGNKVYVTLIFYLPL